MMKSPCIDKCKLNPKNNLCEGCYRTSDEITQWGSYSTRQKKNIMKLLNTRKLSMFCVLFFILIFNKAYTNDIWVGKWVALDQWQSEFQIEINKDGSANTDYGNGDIGTWTIIDGNIEIQWQSGKKDYIFSGVMGYQRLSKEKNNSYTSGLKKLLN